MESQFAIEIPRLFILKKNLVRRSRIIGVIRIAC